MKKFTYKYFNDLLYGGIGVSKLEAALIDTPIFQRLRRIRQMGLCSLVFPGAEHTRFNHSLGTLFVMGKMCEFLCNEGIISESDVVKLRLAALLHDIGHYPFSHLTEQVYMKILEDDNLANIVQINGEDRKSLLTIMGEHVSQAGRNANHERLGAKLVETNREISDLLKKYNQDPLEIGQIITGAVGTQIWSQLMHSGLDCDRLDYLHRDSLLTGVNYGKVDTSYLIRLLRMGTDDALGQNVLGIDEKGTHVVEHYLMGRYFHYARVIGHKTVRAFECVAKAALYILFTRSGTWPFNTYNDILKLINSDQFLHFHDLFLTSVMHGECDVLAEPYRTYVNALQFRKRPKVIFERTVLGGKNFPEEYQNLRRELRKNPTFIAEALRVDKDLVGWHEFTTSIENLPSHLHIDATFDDRAREQHIEDYREAVRIIGRDGKARLLVGDPNSVVSRLASHKMYSIIVFYLEPDSDTKEEAETRQSRAVNAIKESIK